MRVAFDYSPFRYDTTRGPSGVAKWSLGALSALSELAPEWQLIGAAPGFEAPRVTAEQIGPNAEYRRIPFPKRPHRVLELLGIEPRIETWTGRVDAVLGNAFITAKSRRAASLPIIHDLSIVKHPQMHTKERLVYVAGQLSRVVHRATLVITLTKCMQEEIADHFGIPEEKIAIVPPSWQMCPFPLQSSPETEEPAPIPAEYFLFVGTLEPRKNIHGLLTAHARLRARRPDAPQLLIVGGRGWGSHTYSELLNNGIASGSVRRLGYISNELLASLYRGAVGLAYPSLYEGFGIPILEAMAAGCPVITSDRSGMAEVAGGAALLVDPTSADEIEAALEAVIDDSLLRDELRQKGLERAGNFSWQRSGAKLKEAIELAVGSLGR